MLPLKESLVSRGMSRRSAMSMGIFKDPGQVRILESDLQHVHSIVGLNILATHHTEDPKKGAIGPLPYVLLTTEIGNRLIHNGLLYEIESSSFLETHEPIRPDYKHVFSFNFDSQQYFLKLNRWYNTAPFEFLAAHLLALEGVHINTLVLATRSRLVTKAVIGDHINLEEPKGKEKYYIYWDVVNKIWKNIVAQRKWLENNNTASTRLDIEPRHLRIRDLSSQNPLEWFTLIDPFYCTGIFFSANEHPPAFDQLS